jgi:hypothetical protein
MQQRPAGDVWQGLYEPILEEVSQPTDGNGTLIYEEQRVLSHQKINMRFWVVDEALTVKGLEVLWQPLGNINALPVSKSVENLFASAAFKEFINTFV